MLRVNQLIGFGARRAAGSGNPYSPYLVAGLHFDGDFSDVTGRSWSTFGATNIDTSVKKFGAGSVLIDNSNDYVEAANHSDFNFGSGEFTIECWIRYNSIDNAYQGIICHDEIGGTRGWLILKNNHLEASPHALNFTAWVGATPFSVVDSVPLTAGGSFVHVSAVRDQSSGDVLRLYKGGAQVGATSITGSIGAPSVSCVMGTLWGTSGALLNSGHDGWIDDPQIYKGVCLHPGGTTFTPPTAAFTYP